MQRTATNNNIARRGKSSCGGRISAQKEQYIGGMEIFRILQDRHGAEKSLQTLWQRQTVHDRWQHDRLTTTKTADLQCRDASLYICCFSTVEA